MPGELDPDCRRAFPEERHWDRALLRHHQTLIRLRLQHVALRIGAYNVLAAEGEGYVFARVHSEETIIVGLNAGHTAQTLTLPAASGGTSA